MKVKLTVSRAGVGFSQNANEIIEVSETEGLAIIKSGQGEAVTVVEKATAKRTAKKATK